MKHLFIAALGFLMQAGGQPIPIPIQNPSFEQAISMGQDSCGPWSTVVPGWTGTQLQAGGGYGVLQPSNPNPCGISLPPDGSKVAYLFRASISQDLGPAPTDDGFYTVTVFTGNRFYWYNAEYLASIKIGSLILCSVYGRASGDFIQVPFVCPAQRKQGELVITLSANGEFQALLDNVSLTFTPTN